MKTKKILEKLDQISDLSETLWMQIGPANDDKVQEWTNEIRKLLGAEERVKTYRLG